jgi:type III secretory pathway component EscS
MKKITIAMVVMFIVGSFQSYIDEKTLDVVAHLLGLSIIMWVFALLYKVLKYTFKQLKTIKLN